MSDLEEQVRHYAQALVDDVPAVSADDVRAASQRRGRLVRWRVAPRLVVAAALATVLVAGGVLLMVLADVDGPGRPTVLSGPGTPDGGVPVNWVTVEISEAALSVPPDWDVVPMDGERSLPCRFTEHAIYVGDPGPPSSCPTPALEPPPEKVAIVARSFVLLGGRLGTEVELGGFEAHWEPFDEGRRRRYVVPDLKVILEVVYDPDPGLAERVLGTLRASGETSQERTPAEPAAARLVPFEVLGTGQDTEFMGRLDHADTQLELATLWEEFAIDGPVPEVDLERSVVLFVARHDDGCFDLVDRLELEGDRLTPRFVDPPQTHPNATCPQPLLRHGYAVAVARDQLPEVVIVRLPAWSPEGVGYPEQLHPITTS